MPRLALIGLTAALLTMAIACQSSPDLDRPPMIYYGEDICEQCNMIISEPRYAAGYVMSDGNIRRFDDIGDMLAYHAANGEDVAVFWVHDYDSEEWIKASDAHFVIGENLTTPMAHGVVAFLDPKRAENMAMENAGRVAGFEELLNIDLPSGLPLHSHMEFEPSDKMDPGTTGSHNGGVGSMEHNRHGN